MVTLPEEWTLEWNHAPGMPDWTVIPYAYQTVEREGDFQPAQGALLAWLTVRRVG